MILNQDSQSIESNGVTETGDFSIKTNPAAFQLLSSGLYSNKIRAVIRELACNAVDAHAMVGKTTLPVEIKMPNDLDTTFYVKDFGPGMSHEQIMRLYTTYFDSTKRDSNDFIGGFGVGSKSPFAYTDSFTVESRQGGVARTYAAYVEDGFPKIAFLAEEQTTDDAGLTVSFPVKPSDFPRFSSEASDVLQWFQTKPDVKGLSAAIPDIPYLRLSTQVSVPQSFRTGGYHHVPETLVRMGDVVYPLNRFFTQLAVNDTDRATFDWIRQRKVLLETPIGSISVAASREDLSYDKPTMETLRRVLREAYVLVVDEVIAQIKTLDATLWADRQRGHTLLQATGLSSLWSNSTILSNAGKSHKQTEPLLNKELAARGIDPATFVAFLYQAQEFDTSAFKTLHLGVATNTNSVHTWDELRHPGLYQSGKAMPDLSKEVRAFVADVPVKSAWATKAWKSWKTENMPLRNNNNHYFFVITPHEAFIDTPEFEAEKQLLIETLGKPVELKPLSSGLSNADRNAMLGRADKSVFASTFFTNKTTRVYEGRPFLWVTCTSSGAVVAPADLDDNLKVAYCNLVRSMLTVDSDGKPVSGVKEFLQVLGVPTSRIYRVSPDDTATLTTMKGACSLVDVCAKALSTQKVLDKINAFDKEVDVGPALSTNPLASVMYSGSYGAGRHLTQALPGTRLGSLVEKLQALKLRQATPQLAHTMNLLALLNTYAGEQVILPQCILKIDSLDLFSTAYPMLPSFMRNVRPTDVQHMHDYITWCELQRAKDPVFEATMAVV